MLASAGSLPSIGTGLPGFAKSSIRTATASVPGRRGTAGGTELERALSDATRDLPTPDLRSADASFR